LPLLAGLPSFVDRAMVAFRLAVPFIQAFANVMKILGTIMKPVFWLLEKIADLFEAAEDSWWGRILSDMFVGATTGAVAGSAVPVVGTGIGAGLGALAGGIGGTVNEFHAGGVTDKPTAGIFGEAGREALVPLTKYDMELTKKSSPMGVSSSNSGLTLNLTV
jgi:hypothetical protein